MALVEGSMSKDCRSGLDAENNVRVERRAHARASGPFDGAWSGGSQPCRISNLSVVGCYVECLAPLDQGLRVNVKIELPREGRISVGAEIIYKESGMGFAVRFLDLSSEVYEMLERTVSPTCSPTARLM
jgi:hypothetical protein